MFRDGVGSIEPKGVNVVELIMYYNITSLKDIAPHQPNYRRSIYKLWKEINFPNMN